MTEYISRACPYCGGPQLNKRDGELVCAYCLQPLDISNGKLSEGYNKLASYNFAGAATFFRSMIGVAGAEAYYGLFLANRKIEENRRKNAIFPIVYSYCPQSFESDGDFVALKNMCERERGIAKRLEAIEAARASSLEPRERYDAVAYHDAGSAAECGNFCKVLSSRGYRVLKCSDPSAADIATLRNAAAAYAFVSSSDTAEKLAQSKLGRRFMLLENRVTVATGIGKKPIKLVTAVQLPEILVEALRDGFEICGSLNIAAEIRRLGKSGVFGTEVKTQENNAPAHIATQKERIAEPVAEIKNQSADIERMRRSLDGGDCDGALKQFEKLRKNGCGAPELYWYAYLASAQMRNGEEFVAHADESAFTPAALSLCDEALYRCGGANEAKPYVDTLYKAALRLIDRKKPKLAVAAIDAAFAYDKIDGYADSLFSRIDAAKAGMKKQDCFDLQKKLLEKLGAQNSPLFLARTVETIDYALSCGDFAVADDLTEGALDYFPAESKLYARKVFAENRVSGFAAVYARSYPKLGQSYREYLATLVESERARELKSAFAALVKNAENNGFGAAESALDDVLGLGRSDCVASPVFGAREYCKAGNLALADGDFDWATAYFENAVKLDNRSYDGYWGALKAALKCRNDRELEESDVSPDETSYYEKAYNAAYGRDEAFIKNIEKVLSARKSVEKRDGHVFRKDDFIIENGVLKKYIGHSTDKVYVSGGVYRIGANAFRGCDCKSVIVGEGVTGIGDYAFAYGALERIVLPQGISKTGVNPFLGCNRLDTVSASGRMHTFGGGLYCGDKLVGFLLAMNAKAGLGDDAEVEKGTTAICEKAFYNTGAPLSSVSFPSSLSKIAPCAFYGYDGVKIKGNVPRESLALGGEGIFGDCEFDGDKLINSGKPRWNTLYGDGANNMATEHKADGGSTAYRKIVDTRGKVSGGLLIKNDRLIYAAGGSLYFASLADALGGKPTEQLAVEIDGYRICGTGALWREYVIVPTEKDECTLYYVDCDGSVAASVALPAPLTRSLCVCDDTLLCVCGDTLVAVDLPTAKTIERVMPEKITSVPCVLGGGFVAAGERNMYFVNTKLEGGAVCALRGVKYAEGSGKILRGRVVAYGGAAYWIERTDSSIMLCSFDGKSAIARNMPRSVVDFMQTPPVFCGGSFYGGATKSVVTATADCRDEWTFRVCSQVSGKYSDIAVAGGKPFVCGLNGASENLRLRALYENVALMCDVVNGGIYAARI